MIKYATLAEAKLAAKEWGGIPETVKHISNSGSSVFCFQDSKNSWKILRLTDATFRTYEEVQAELEFLSYLKECSLNIAYGIPAKQGSLLTELATQAGVFICSVLSYIEGVYVEESSQHWHKKFFREWGRSLASIHQASQGYNPSATTPKPWIWSEEILLRQADQLLPPDDFISRQEYRKVLDLCHSLEKSPETFGVIHADYGPQNFRYNPATGEIQ